MNMKKNIVCILVLVFVSVSYGQAGPADEAQSLFANGKYLEGMNILTAAINDPDPVQRAYALEAYAEFYENIVGNTGYALTMYGNILGTNLPVGHPIRALAQKEIDKLKLLKSQYNAEDTLLKKLQPPEVAKPEENIRQATLLRSIIDKKPDYYRLYEVYYHLGRNYLVAGNYHQAYILLKKSLELRPGINFYLPVNVYKDMAQAKWIRSIINSISRGILGVLLVITVIAFYYSCPWKWLKLSHLAVWLSIVLLWLIIFSISYKLLTSNHGISDKTMAEISAAPPCFVDCGPDSQNWQVVKSLFVYGLVGISGLFVFSIGIVGLKHRWVAIMINAVFGLLLFAVLAAVFYMHNCDQKSVFISDVQNGFFRYVEGKNYFVDFGMEPYILTNPGAYPDLAVENVADIHLHQWVESRCPFSPPAGKRSP
jgi:tetratricopeptide (TPR) repeat protein